MSRPFFLPSVAPRAGNGRNEKLKATSYLVRLAINAFHAAVVLPVRGA